MSAWLGGGQLKLCRASVNMSLVQTEASLINRNIIFNRNLVESHDRVFISLQLAHNLADDAAIW